MNPNAEAFRPGPVSPEPGLRGGNCQPRSSQQVPQNAETYTRKGSDPPDPDSLDPKKYDDMFPSLETSTKKPAATNTGASSRNKKKRTVMRYLGKEAQALNTTPPSVPKFGPEPDPQGPSMSGKTRKPTSSTPVREPPKTKLHDVKPITPLKLAWVENKQQIVTSIPSSAPPSTTKAQTMEVTRTTTNMPPTPKPDHELSIKPKVGKIAAPSKAISSFAPLPTHPSPMSVLPVPGPFGYPITMPQPPPVPSNGGFFYYPETYSPSFMPAPHHPMPNMHMHMHIPQVQGPVEQVAWETAFAHPGPVWLTPQPPNLFGPGVPQLWQAGGYQGPQSSFDTSSSTHEATRTPRQFQVPSRARSRPTDPRRQHRTGGQDVHSRPASTSSHRTRAEAVKQVDTPYFKQRARSSEPSQDIRIKTTAMEFPREQTPCPTRSTTRMQIQPFKMVLREDVEKDMAPAGVSQINPGQAGSVIKYHRNNRASLNNDSGNSQGQLVPRTVPAKSQMAQATSPPEEAPKGPKASTALQLRVPRLTVAQTESPAGPSSDKAGSWSQSKRWVSGETKERTAFQRMLINLHYMGADKSPFVPQNPAELTAFKAEVTETEKVKLLNEVEKMQASARTDGKDKGQPLVLFGGKELQDKLSPVFAIVSCFDREPATQTSLVEWPSLAELKEEGDKRGVFNTRCFPLPRLNILPVNLPFGNQDSLFNLDGSIRWNKKKVRLGFLDITPVNAPDPDDRMSFDDVEVTELPYSFNLILNHIEGVQEKEQGLHKKEEKQG